MKAIFVSYNKAYNMEIADMLESMSCRGFTMWQGIMGRGSETGEPHYGSHAWPTMNDAMLVFVEDGKVDAILSKLGEMDASAPALGLKAFVWGVDKSL